MTKYLHLLGVGSGFVGVHGGSPLRFSMCLKVFTIKCYFCGAGGFPEPSWLRPGLASSSCCSP